MGWVGPSSSTKSWSMHDSKVHPAVLRAWLCSGAVTHLAAKPTALPAAAGLAAAAAGAAAAGLRAGLGAAGCSGRTRGGGGLYSPGMWGNRGGGGGGRGIHMCTGES
jgi:hypothetical protein